MAAIFPGSYGKANQLGQSVAMVVAALANWVIVYFLFAYNMPLDKIENTEGVITAVSERFVFYFLA
jgi:hypothetical protein